MNDLGEEMKGLQCAPEPGCNCSDCSGQDKKPQIHYPRESFNTTQMPELSRARLGDKVKLIIEAEVCAVRSGAEYDYGPEEDKNETRITLKLLQGMAKITSAPDNTDIKDMKSKSSKDANDFGLPEPASDVNETPDENKD